MPRPSIACFGEVLWDVLPHERIVGGAPLNVGFHANQLGLNAQVISRIGTDALGTELKRFLAKIGVVSELIQVDENLPTGVVNVSFLHATSPVYDIVSPAAWDFILPNPKTKDYIKNADALVFGSLACRTERNQQTLFGYLDYAPVRVFDVNLRAPYYSQELVEKLLENTHIVKMNEEEFDLIIGWRNIEGDEQSQLQKLKDLFELEAIILTKGKNGAVCLSDSGFCFQPSFEIQVRDTIGSGDAFLAAFLTKYLEKAATDACLQFASAVGAIVASKKGGTPPVHAHEIEALIHSIDTIHRQN